MSEENKPPEKKIEFVKEGKSLAELLNIASSQMTFENMQALCNQSSYTVEGVEYKRRMLKPKDIVKLQKLQRFLDESDDPEKRMNAIKDQAFICLEGMTDKKWEDTDAGKMEIIVGACMLISKGFRRV